MPHFNIGDRIVVTKKQQSCPVGTQGTIVCIQYPYYGIQLDTYSYWAHTLEGRVRKGFGYWVEHKNLTLSKEDQSTYKYNCIVNKIKYLDKRYKDRIQNDTNTLCN